jgi:hypothetical protein
MESTNLGWRKSSYSGNGGESCVEVAGRGSVILVRDTKDHGRGQVHRFTTEEWHAFVAGLKATRDA